MKLELKGKRILLRPPRMSDAEDIYRNLRVRIIGKWLPNLPKPYKKKNASEYVRKCKRDLEKMEQYNFLITEQKTGIVAGAIGFVKLDKKDKNGELGYWLGKRYWGKGFMSEAVGLILNFGFNKLKLHRIYARVFEENIASSVVLKKAGFKLEGRMREKWHRFGRWHDVLSYSILDREFKARRK